MDVATDAWSPAREVWNRLQRLSIVKFNAKSENEPSWTGTATGLVTVESANKESLIISESGLWIPARGQPSRFNNVLRWTLLAGDVVRLEHLRFGMDHPVHLFDLVSDSFETWTSIAPHVCKEDCYSATMRPHVMGIDFWWAICGPKKQTSIAYEYRWHDM